MLKKLFSRKNSYTTAIRRDIAEISTMSKQYEETHKQVLKNVETIGEVNIMTKGQKLIYGNNDKVHSIECIYTGNYRITKDGEIVISATCEDATIIAPIEMFTEIK